MPGRPRGDQLDRPRQLLGGLHGGEAHLSALARHGAGFGQAVLGVDRPEVLVHHELDADAGRPFLAGFRQEDDVAIERHIQPLQGEHRHERCHDVVLVVERAAPVDVAVRHHRPERRMRPLGGIDVDRVRMPHHEQRTLPAGAFQPRDDVRPAFVEGEHLDRNAFVGQHLLKVIGGFLLASRRVLRVEADQRLEVGQRFLLQRRPVGVARRLLGGDDGGEQCRAGGHAQAFQDRTHRSFLMQSLSWRKLASSIHT